MNRRNVLLFISVITLSLYGQDPPKGQSKQLVYTFSRGGDLQTRLYKRLEFKESTIYSEDTEDFLLYPNPANDFLIIDLLEIESSQSYQLVNALGKQMLRGNLTQLRTELYLNHLPPGVYYFTLSSLQSTQKFIKN